MIFQLRTTWEAARMVVRAMIDHRCGPRKAIRVATERAQADLEAMWGLILQPVTVYPFTSTVDSDGRRWGGPVLTFGDEGQGMTIDELLTEIDLTLDDHKENG